MSSANSNPTSSSTGGHTYSLWYPWNNASGSPAPAPQQQGVVEDFVRTLMREHNLEHASQILTLRNEIVGLRHEILTLKETVLKLNEDYAKVRPLVDERRRNLLLRRHIPFGFVPEKSHGTAEPEERPK